MSIVNISSENRIRPQDGNRADFTIQLKKPVQRVIGIQLLNATIPLTYNIINPENNTMTYYTGDVGTTDTYKTITLQNGTYSMDGLCREIEYALRGDRYYNEGQRAMHLKARRSVFQITMEDEAANNEVYWPEMNQPTGGTGKISYKQLKPGYIVRNGTTDITYFIKALGPSNGTAFVLKPMVHVEDVFPATSETIHNLTGPPVVPLNVSTHTGGGTVVGGTGTDIYYLEADVLVWFDTDLQSIVIGFTYDIAFGSGKFRNFKFRGNNSMRMKRMIGFDGTEDLVNHPLDSSHKHKFISHTMQGTNVPEPAGPGMLFLRIGGDVILDQQNSETHMNDRIPIPVDKAHGGIVHYENDSESDIIPLAVPCDVTRLKFRVEYGDDNDVIGGKTQNTRGHECYFRIKFYKEHQQHKGKM